MSVSQDYNQISGSPSTAQAKSGYHNDVNIAFDGSPSHSRHATDHTSETTGATTGATTHKDRKRMIRKAYKDHDGKGSRAAHDQTSHLLHKHHTSHKPNYSTSNGNNNNGKNGDSAGTTPMLSNLTNTEDHKKHGEYIKSIIYGGLDGVFTTFALVAGFQGAGSSFENPSTMLVFGFANVVADALSMGVGDFLSEKAENDFAITERAREEWEFENYQQGEIDEMIAIYMEKGMTYEDATTILNIMAKYKDFFIDHMMIQELEIYPVDPNADDYDPYQPFKNGIVTFCSFLLFGSIPLLSYVIFEAFNITHKIGDLKFELCIILSILTLMTLGIVKVELSLNLSIDFMKKLF